MFNTYPYTDAHELNLDWIIAKIQKLDLDIETIAERATQAAIEGTREYVDTELQQVMADFNRLRQEVSRLENDFVNVKAELQAQYVTFVREINAQITLMSSRIDDIRNEIDADIIGVNARTDLAIQQNNEFIFEQIEEHISEEIRVTNFFTGARVPIQDMFNYLALLHVDDGIDIDTLVARNKTVNQIIAINASCTDWVLHGDSLTA